MRKSIIYLLFFVSYSPLFFYLWIINSYFPRTLKDFLAIRLDYYDIYFLISTLSVLAFFLIIQSIKKTAPYTVNIKNIEEKNVEFLSYVMTYFFAFLGLKISSNQDVLGSVFLFCFIAFVYSRSNLIYSNPILAIFGYTIYEGSTENSKRIMIISKQEKITGKNIALVKISEKIYLFSPQKL